MGGTDAEVEVQEVCAGWLGDLGADVDRWDLDLAALAADPWFPGVEVQRSRAAGVAATTPGDGGPAWGLQAPRAVFPPGARKSWRGAEPFSAEIRAGALYGRGACDMKA